MLPPAQSLNGTIDKLVKAWIFFCGESSQEFELDESVVNGLAENTSRCGTNCYRHGLRRRDANGVVSEDSIQVCSGSRRRTVHDYENGGFARLKI
ncbi:hypothetical protein [Pseudomonas chlororaphis]|uniref:Uncharacterized protein n=1 Tax=Pseudomonas chlororaphis subsp. aurantiaca TaxID=86192 RepID=A0AAJ0ZFP4_9PSED|nr:hypothetical protein [Pseudomonas chlororaphis]MBU4631618.1 hypothetical protein [Pseudomonas chlororaphis subsp. aurantiaca]